MRQVLFAVMAGLWCCPVGTAQDVPDHAAAPRAATVSLDVKDANLVDVVKLIKTRSGRNIVMGKNPEGKHLAIVWPPLTVTVQFEDLPWEQALRLVAGSARCLVGRDGDVWTVYQPPEVTIEMERAGLPSPEVTIEMERAELRDVIQAIAAVSGANVVVGSDVPAGLAVSVRLRSIPWFQALNAVVKSVGMVLIKDPGTEIYIVRDPARPTTVRETRVIRLRWLRPLRVEIDGRTRTIVPCRRGQRPFDLLEEIRARLTRAADGRPVGSSAFDHQTNSLIVSDTGETLDAIEALIQRHDRSPTADDLREELDQALGKLRELERTLTRLRKRLEQGR